MKKNWDTKYLQNYLSAPLRIHSAATVTNNVDTSDDYITNPNITEESFFESSYMLSLTSSETVLPYKDFWVFDSGSGRHICHNKELFWTLKRLITEQLIITGAGNCKVEGVGSVFLRVNTPKGLESLKVDGVLYVPNFMTNIISMDRMKDQMLIWDYSENWLTSWDQS